MDRTRGMTLSEKEKEDIRKEDLHRKVKGYCLKLLDKPEMTDEILSSLNEEPEADRQELKTMVWRELVEGLPHDKEVFKHLDVLEKLPQAELLTHTLKELRSSLNSALKDTTAARQKVLTRERKKLAALGISGSAVVPKVSRDPDLDPDFPSILAKYGSRLLVGAA